MCEICMNTPCVARCPNKLEEPIEQCVACESPMFANDKGIRSEKGFVCDECIRSMNADEMEEYFGLQVEILG